MDAYAHITEIEIEVFLWRRGSTRVNFDFQRAYFTWTETSRWNRNFARSMSSEDISQLRETCRDIDLLAWDSRCIDPMNPMHGAWYRAWSIIVCFDDEIEESKRRLCFGDRDKLPKGFMQLSDVIRRICRQDFRVSE